MPASEASIRRSQKSFSRRPTRSRVASSTQFPLVVWQTGSGTQSNMNTNEVLANRANEISRARRGGKDPVHPNETSTRVSPPTISSRPRCTCRGEAVRQRLLPALTPCTRRLATGRGVGIDREDRPHAPAGRDAANARSGILRLRRAGRRRIERVESVLRACCELAQGGTAVGTGLNAPKGFAEEFAKEIAELTGCRSPRAQQVRGASRARRDGRAIRRPQGHRGRAARRSPTTCACSARARGAALAS